MPLSEQAVSQYICHVLVSRPGACPREGISQSALGVQVLDIIRSTTWLTAWHLSQQMLPLPETAWVEALFLED